jgi:hypothetical protein
MYGPPGSEDFERADTTDASLIETMRQRERTAAVLQRLIYGC